MVRTVWTARRRKGGNLEINISVGSGWRRREGEEGVPGLIVYFEEVKAGDREWKEHDGPTSVGMVLGAKEDQLANEMVLPLPRIHAMTQ